MAGNKASAGRAGFSLIELMITVAVMAVLAALAYPSYQDYVRKVRRADAHSALMQIQLAQERWRAARVSYAPTLAELGLSTRSVKAHYDLTLTAVSAVGFTATASGRGDQARDRRCPVIRLVGTFGGASHEPPDCW